MKLAVAASLIMLGLSACGSAIPKHEGPTVKDMQATCAVIDSRLEVLRNDLMLWATEDANHEPHAWHSPLWWRSEVGLLDDTAAVASTMGHK